MAWILLLTGLGLGLGQIAVRFASAPAPQDSTLQIFTLAAATFLCAVGAGRIGSGLAVRGWGRAWRLTYRRIVYAAMSSTGAAAVVFLIAFALALLVWCLVAKGKVPASLPYAAAAGAIAGLVWSWLSWWSVRGLMRGVLSADGHTFEVADKDGLCPYWNRKWELAKRLESGRKIVIFCDGTSNSPDQTEDGLPAATNIFRMYDALRKDETQIGWYDPGVGTDTSSDSLRTAVAQSVLNEIGLTKPGALLAVRRKFRTLLEAATGLGITENIVQAYAEIARRYRPGDRIYLFGFSRGAYTARCVAGTIARCGLLRPENAALAPQVVELYKSRENPVAFVPIAPELIHAEVPRVEMLGVFDTVGSLGVPLWGWWFNFKRLRHAPLSTSPAPICENIHHALAMDERRAQFFPTLFEGVAPKENEAAQRLHQVWFRGAHADVGGGYARRGLSDITLDWMLAAAWRHGLLFDLNKLRDFHIAPDPLEIPHDEMERQLAWKAAGSWPRWHPIPSEVGFDTGAPTPAAIDRSVDRRATAMNALGRFDLRTLVVGNPATFSAGASRQWNNTGIAIETGGVYEVTADPKFEWRDASSPPCGPEGQDLGWSTLADWLRRAFSKFKRLPDERYMTLCVNIAHPRPWPLREFGIGRLLRYLLERDPAELRAQVAPIGRNMGNGATVYIRNIAPGGILHTFANDLWITDANNYGALKLTIKRVASVPVGALVWTLDAKGTWTDPKGNLRTPDSPGD